MPRGSNEFLDTNVLLYEWDAAEQVKREKAQKLIAGRSAKLVISSQIAQEFAYNARLKFKLSALEVDRILASYSAFAYATVDMKTVRAAISTAEQAQLSFWDALVIETAAAAGCTTLWTEDLSHGQVIRGVKIRNPFK